MPRNKIEKGVAMIYKRKNIYLFLLLLITLPGLAQNFSESKKYHHQFKVSPKTTVELSNKYGKIQILTWNKDSVKVDIDVYLSSPSISRLQKLKDNIAIDYTTTNYYVIVKTVFGKSQSNVIDEIKDFADAIVNGSNEVRIDYNVYLPQNQALKVSNKYGDIYTDDLTGDITLTLANGDLKANNFTGNTQINLSFGNAFINEIAKGRLTAEYADMDIKSAENITLESKSSKIRLDKAGTLRLQSRRDDLRIESANSILGDTYFTSAYFQQINEELNVNGKFGKLTAENIKKTFSFVNLNSEYTDMDLYFERGSAFDYDISYYKDVIMRLPKEAEKTEEKSLTADLTQKIVYGKVGAPSKDSKVKIAAPKKCYLNLYLN